MHFFHDAFGDRTQLFNTLNFDFFNATKIRYDCNIFEIFNQFSLKFVSYNLKIRFLICERTQGPLTALLTLHLINQTLFPFIQEKLKNKRKSRKAIWVCHKVTISMKSLRAWLPEKNENTGLRDYRICSQTSVSMSKINCFNLETLIPLSLNSNDLQWPYNKQI